MSVYPVIIIVYLHMKLCTCDQILEISPQVIHKQLEIQEIMHLFWHFWEAMIIYYFIVLTYDSNSCKADYKFIKACFDHKCSHCLMWEKKPFKFCRLYTLYNNC